jgi:hypothetical protein
LPLGRATQVGIQRRTLAYRNAPEQVATQPGLGQLYFASHIDHRRQVPLRGGAKRPRKETGFEIVHVDAYHPHYVTGEHKGFWNWTLRAVALGMVKEGSLTSARLKELVARMTEADASPDTLVVHCRMHQLIAKKPGKKV